MGCQILGSAVLPGDDDDDDGVGAAFGVIVTREATDSVWENLN